MAGLFATVGAPSAPVYAAGPEIVSGPAAEPNCFVPWTDKTKFFKYPAKKGPFRIALANGYIANTWRIQMIKTAKAYAAQPDVAAKLKEFKVVSTGEDVAAQISAVNNFIDSGYDAIVVNAQNPAAFKPVIKRAKDAGVVLVAFDNILDTEDAINVDVDQKGLGVYWAQWLDKHVPERRQGARSARRVRHLGRHDRHDGIHEALDASGKKWDVVEVFGKWDDPTAQKVDRRRDRRAEAFRRLSPRRAATPASCRRCSTPSIRWCRSAARPRTASASSAPSYRAEGLKCSSGGTGPAQVAVAIKTAIAALEGQVVPQSVKLPLATAEDPNFKDGENYYSRRSPTTSSSAIPSRPATSISLRRKSWGRRRRTSNLIERGRLRSSVFRGACRRIALVFFGISPRRGLAA